MSAPRPDFRHLCSACGKAIAWVQTIKGKRISIDLPSAEGKWWLFIAGGELVASFLRDGVEPNRPGALRYTCHFDTCPKKKKPTPSEQRCPVTQCQGMCTPKQVCCKTHWFEIPRLTRDRIVKAKRGSDEHRNLVLDAVRVLNERGAQ